MADKRSGGDRRTSDDRRSGVERRTREDGPPPDGERRAGERHRELVSWLDKAAARGTLHRNTAARRKAQAARLLAGERD